MNLNVNNVVKCFDFLNEYYYVTCEFFMFCCYCIYPDWYYRKYSDIPYCYRDEQTSNLMENPLLVKYGNCYKLIDESTLITLKLNKNFPNIQNIEITKLFPMKYVIENWIEKNLKLEKIWRVLPC